MSKLIPLGAINKHTGEYVYPKIANKKDSYICPDCNKDLTLCQGKIRTHHFRHKVDSVNPCNHYDHPSESQIHKDAKALLKTLLDKKIPITFIRKCETCEKPNVCKIKIPEASTVHIEYRFEYNGPKIADVALLDEGAIVYIFEICNTHRTCAENRPEPWFEIDAKTLVETANDVSDTLLQIPCIRNEKCYKCAEKHTYYNPTGDIYREMVVEHAPVGMSCDLCNVPIKTGDKVGTYRFNPVSFCEKCNMNQLKYRFVTRSISIHELNFPDSTVMLDLEGKWEGLVQVICQPNFSENEQKVIEIFNINNIEDLIRSDKISKTDKQRCLQCFQYVRMRYEQFGAEPYNGHNSIQLDKYVISIRILPDGTIKYCKSFGEGDITKFTRITMQ